MEAWKRTMWVLWVCVFFCAASFTMAIPFLSLFLLELGVNDASVNIWAGGVHSAGFLMGAIMAPVWGTLADRSGKKKMVVRAGFCLVVVYTLLYFVQNPVQLLLVRMLHGFISGFVPASLSIVASVAPEKEMGWSLGVMQAGVISGGIFGPLFGGLLSTWLGMRMSFLAAGVIMLITVLAVVFWVHEGKRTHTLKKSNILKDFKWLLSSKVLATLLLLLLLLQMSVNMIQTLLALHVSTLNVDIRDAALMSGIALSLVGIAGIIAAPRWGRAGEQRGYAKMLLICQFAAGAIIFTQFFVSEFWLFATILFVYGLFIAGITPILNTLMVHNTDESFRGRTFGFSASANQLGSTIGPLIGGGLGFLFNTNWIFAASGVLLVSAGAIAYFNLVLDKKGASDTA